MDKWVTHAKIGHTLKIVLLGKMGQTRKNASLGKTGHTWKNGLYLKNWVALEKNGAKKIMSHLVKWITLVKMVHIWKKMSYTCKIGSHL